jgi:hypothetical protein
MNCEGTIHAFETTDDVPTPREQKCLCGDYTWGWMDDKLAETEGQA